MKRFFYRVCRKLWSMTAFVCRFGRRPLRERVQGELAWATFNEHFLVMSSMVRELMRLQDQVEVLRQMVQDLAAAQPGNSLAVGDPGTKPGALRHKAG
jgi:hypothetical protein